MNIEEMTSRVHEADQKAAVAKAQERAWRDAFHSLRGSIEERLGRIEAAIREWEDDE